MGRGEEEEEVITVITTIIAIRNTHRHRQNANTLHFVGAFYSHDFHTASLFSSSLFLTASIRGFVTNFLDSLSSSLIHSHSPSIVHSFLSRISGNNASRNKYNQFPKIYYYCASPLRSHVFAPKLE